MAGQMMTCPVCHHPGEVPSFIAAPAMAIAHPVQPKVTRGVYIVLALFLGGLGIHNFVAGRIGPGLGQLFTMLFLWWLIFPIFIVGFWILIEIITVDRDGNGVRM